MYNLIFKRLFDALFSLFLIIIFLPIFLIIYMLVRIFLGTPVIFKQVRPGKNEKLFTLYKFRTMKEDKNKNGEYLSDKMRLTNFGKSLRASSLDELPELFNILKGDMSFVGPRPLLQKYLPLYSEDQKKRHLVKPGLTGLAQVNGRNAITWEKKFEYDLLYINSISFFCDIKIIFCTIYEVFKRTGITDDSVSMKEFKG